MHALARTACGPEHDGVTSGLRWHPWSIYSGRSMTWLNSGSLAGLFVSAGLAWATGGFARPIAWRTVLGSAGLMLLLGFLIFWVPPTRTFLIWVNDAVLTLLVAGNQGALFLLGPLAVGPGQTTPAGEPSVGLVLAAQVLPALIFFAALMALLYHVGAIQPVVWLFARLFHHTLGLSGAESLGGQLQHLRGRRVGDDRPALPRADDAL